MAQTIHTYVTVEGDREQREQLAQELTTTTRPPNWEGDDFRGPIEADDKTKFDFYSRNDPLGLDELTQRYPELTFRIYQIDLSMETSVNYTLVNGQQVGEVVEDNDCFGTIAQHEILDRVDQHFYCPAIVKGADGTYSLQKDKVFHEAYTGPLLDKGRINNDPNVTYTVEDGDPLSLPLPEDYLRMRPADLRPAAIIDRDGDDSSWSDCDVRLGPSGEIIDLCIIDYSADVADDYDHGPLVTWLVRDGQPYTVCQRWDDAFVDYLGFTGYRPEGQQPVIDLNTIELDGGAE